LAFSELHLQAIPDNFIEILIAELTILGYDGFRELDNALKAYIDSEKYLEDDVIELLKKYQLSDASHSIAELPEINWNKEWESNYDPVIIDNRVIIKASFHDIENLNRFEYIIHLDPKMSFGTGHHETTTMMIQEMLATVIEGKTILDFGTGTGVLAIMAYLLKAKHIEAVDHEQWAVENAKENTEKNYCSSIYIERSDETYLENKNYDIILANVNRTVILDNLQNFSNSLKSGGKILFSGLLIQDAENVIEQCRLHNLALHKSMKMNKWALLSLIKN